MSGGFVCIFMTELRHILCVIIFLDCHRGKQIGIPKDVEGQSKIPLVIF